MGSSGSKPVVPDAPGATGAPGSTGALQQPNSQTTDDAKIDEIKPAEPVAPPSTEPPKKSLFDMIKFWGGSHEKVVIVKLWAKWCGHCQTLEPIWKQLVHQYSKHPNIIFEQLEDETIKKGGLIGLKHKYGNRIEEPQGFPTLYIFRSSDTKKQLPYHGERTFEGMKKEIEKLLMHVRKGHHKSTVKKGGAKKKKANKTMHKRR